MTRNDDRNTFTPELEAGARAMWEYWHGHWNNGTAATQQDWCRAFAAGLLALLPVSYQTDRLLAKKMHVCDCGNFEESISEIITAAIRHIAGQS